MTLLMATRDGIEYWAYVVFAYPDLVKFFMAQIWKSKLRKICIEEADFGTRYSGT